jgi:antibiotic biosynthesis monooxygenase (ABM) superfamily enzyme
MQGQKKNARFQKGGFLNTQQINGLHTLLTLLLCNHKIIPVQSSYCTSWLSEQSKETCII